MNPKVKFILKLVFFLSLGFFFIWWFQRKLTPEEKNEIYSSFFNANYLWVFVSFIPGLLSHWIRSVRWRMLLKPMGYNPNKKLTFTAVMIGYLANLAFPRLGEIMRCGILSKYEKIPVEKSFGTVITERTVDIIIFFFLFSLTLILDFYNLKDYMYNNFWVEFAHKYQQFHLTSFIGILILSLIIISVFLFIIFKKKIQKSNLYIKTMVVVMGFVEGLKSLSKIEKPFLFIFYSFFIWFNYFLMTWLIFLCFNQTSNLGLNVALATLVTGSIGIMIVPGGIGIYPLIVSQTLIIFAIPKTVGYAVGWIAWSSQTLLIIIFGISGFLFLSFFKRKKK